MSKSFVWFLLLLKKKRKQDEEDTGNLMLQPVFI